MTVHIFGGGTYCHVASHLSLAAEAGGSTARTLAELLGHAGEFYGNEPVKLTLTKQADPKSRIATNNDVQEALMSTLKDPSVTCVVFNVAACDVYGVIDGQEPGKYSKRIKTREIPPEGLVMRLFPAPKILNLVKKLRPDIYAVGFKTTTHDSVELQIKQANKMSLEHGLDLVLANDTGTRKNLILPGQGKATQSNKLFESYDRDAVLRQLAYLIRERVSV